MSHNPAHCRRRSIRLGNYDYTTAGAYFVTMCAYGRECLFGEIVNGEMVPNAAGICIMAVWDSLPGRYPDIALDEFVIMPNHVHGIIMINEPVGASNENG
jgi:REP element-mobilizing transposase RayT